MRIEKSNIILQNRHFDKRKTNNGTEHIKYAHTHTHDELTQQVKQKPTTMITKRKTQCFEKRKKTSSG